MWDVRIQTVCTVLALIVAVIIGRNQLYDFFASKINLVFRFLIGQPIWAYTLLIGIFIGLMSSGLFLLVLLIVHHAK